MSSRRRSLLKRKRPGSNELDALEALETTEESDLEFEEFEDDLDEDLEVVENTLRGGSYGSFDEVGPPMDSAVMDEVTGELPADGLWLDSKMDALFKKADPAEEEPTEPALPREELLPPMPSPPNYWGTPGIATRQKRPPTPPPAPVVSTETQPGLERRATPDEVRMVAVATPWIAAIGMSAVLALFGLFGVLLLAWLLRPTPFEPEVELGAQPPISGPIDGVEEEPVVDEVPADEAGADEEEVEEVAVEPAPSPTPRPPPAAPAPEPDDLWDAGDDAELLAPAPVPAPEPVPEPETDKKRGLFGKKKNK